MEQVFRIEIPVEAVDKTDTAALQQLESTLQKIFAAMKQNKSAAGDVFDAIERGATEAKAAMQQVENATEKTADSYNEAANAASDAGGKQEQAASGAESAAEKLDSAVSEVSEAYEETGASATEAGRKSGSAFNQATSSADKFTQRIEKSEKTLRSMFKEKLQLIISAIDKASPVLKTIWGTAKSLAGKAWNVAVRMKDFVTAPFRKLYNMLTSPITLALSVAGIGISAGEVVSTFNEFETGMSAVKSLTGATDEEFALLKQTAKELGAETTFSASEASEGMQYLASAGWQTNEIIAAMPGLLDLAAAGATDLATASDIVANVMNAMGMEASEASRTADVFAKTAAASNASIEDLGETLKYAAPIAHSFGMSLEEVSALAGLMANAGIKGSMAGTAIRSSLMSMATPTDEAAKLMKKLKLSFVNADGSMKDMSVIVSDLQEKFAGLTEAQKLQYTETLFGTYASSAWLGVINQGSEAYDNLTTSLEESTGAAKEMANIRLDNLAGDMEALGGAIETAKLELMEKLDPYLRKAVQWLTNKMPQVQAALENAIDKVIEKVTALKDHIKGVFDSDEFKNADGFAEKFFVAWDKIVAEPFAEWWNGEGQSKVLGVVENIGENIGKVLHGIIAGIFAALKGEEIDFEGLNLTGIAKAGAETAKTFVSSFMSAFDLGGLAGNMPGILKAGLFGLGAIKIGQGAYGITKTVKALKEVFGGVTGAAATAKVATTAVGQAAATSAVGIGKASAVLGGLKTALAAIPVWGWVAAAAVTATAFGIKLYTDAQERHRQELLHSSEAGAEAAEQYRESAKQYIEYTRALDGYGGHTVELETVFKPITEEDKQTITDTVTELEQQRIDLETVLADGGLSESERTKLSAQILEIEADRIALSFTFTMPTQEEKDAINQQIDMLELQKIDIQALIAGGGLPPEQVAALEQQISDIEISQIALKAVIEPLTEEEIKLLTDKLSEIEAEKINIQAKIDGGGLPPEEIANLEQQIADLNSKEVLIKATLGTLSDEEIAQYASQQLGIDYDKLIELSGGQITQEDVEAGRVTDERIQQVEDTLATKAATDLLKLQTEVERGRALVPEHVEARSGYEAEYQSALQTQDNLETARANLMQLERDRAYLVQQDELYSLRVGLGTMSQGDYDKWYEETFMPGIGSIRERYESDVVPYAVDDYGLPVINPEAPFFDFLLGDNAFGNALEYIQNAEQSAAEQTASSKSDLDTQNANLVGQYQNEKSLIEGQTFQGSQLANMSLEEVAASYATLDEAGRQMFEDAVMALNTLNAQTDYIGEDEKTQAVDVVDIAAKAEVLSTVQSQVQSIADNYATMTDEQKETFAASEDGAEALKNVNSALESLGLDKIESLDQINTALETLSGVDLSSFSLTDVQAAFVALGGDASGLKTNVDSLRSSLQALDGTTATTTINQVTNRVTNYSTNGSVPGNASGGIYDGAFLSWVAEDGPEAIIPLGAKRRERGIDLWLQAGEMLGVTEFAEGGILAPYSGAMEDIPDEVWDDSDGNGTPKPISTGGSGSGSNTFHISVAANPTFEINGGDSSEDILDKLKAKQKELAELLGSAFAEELEDIVSNMV